MLTDPKKFASCVETSNFVLLMSIDSINITSIVYDYNW